MGTHRFHFVGGDLCLDFINTVHWRGDPQRRRDMVESPQALRSWAVQAGVLGADAAGASSPGAAERACARARRHRELTHEVIAAAVRGAKPSSEALEELSAALRREVAGFHLVWQGERCTWRLKESVLDLDQLLAQFARSALDLLTSPNLTRVSECSGPGCGWLFLDTSRNHSRRWCDMGICGNRVKAKSYYTAHKEEVSARRNGKRQPASRRRFTSVCD